MCRLPVGPDMVLRWLCLTLMVPAVAIGGCTGATTTADEFVDAEPPTPVDRTDDRADAPLVVVLGDSLTAGLGVSPGEAFPARLQERIDAAGYPLRVVDAGVSGDTTAGGLRRAEWALRGDVRLLVVALGGNDGLRGLPVGQMRDNLSQIIETAKARGVRVLLAGMEAPPNFGPEYTSQFRQVFHELAAAHDVAFVPFLLDGVAGDPALNQSDGIHPNAAGASRVAEHLWTTLEPMVAAVASPSQ